MGKVIEFFSEMHRDALEWCRGRLWYGRVPILVYFAYILVRHFTHPHYSSLFDMSLNLGIHELGHYVFAPFGDFLEIAGGTILQCAAPVVAMYFCYRNRQYFLIAVCFGWLSTNFYNVAIYVEDARQLALPLVSPGGPDIIIHDWNNLLARTGMLQHDLTIGFLFRAAGFISMMICLAGGIYLLCRMQWPRKEPEPIRYESHIS